MRTQLAQWNLGHLACNGTLQPRYYITCAGRTDGGGAQIQAIFSTMLYAHCARLVYQHTPIKSVEHNTNRDEDWADKWERAFSPGYAELQSKAIDLDGMRLVPAESMRFELPRPAPTEPTLLVASECHWYADAHPGFYSLIQPRLRQKYARNARPSVPRGDRLTVAVHIRRGDVSERDTERFTPNATVVNQIEQLHRMLASLPHEIHVFSEGSEDDFGPIPDRAVMHLNGDVFECFHALIHAEIFVMAKSSFSYTAALLSRGIVIYNPFWHAPLQRWIVAEEDGQVPESTFQLALSRELLLRSARQRH